MGPTRKSRSVNKRFSYVNEISLTKDGDNTSKRNQRKRKLSDMLGPHWSNEELECFYEAYRKHGKDWRKVAAVLQNRSVEMVEAVYSLNRAYLSLPEGTASVAGFIAMMTDYYSNMEERDSEQESNDGTGTSRKPQRHMQGKVRETTAKGSVERFLLHPEAAVSDYGCLSLLKKKRSGGSRARAVGKRTPRFPVSYSYENVKGEKYFSPSRKGLKLRADNDDEVAHGIAKALAEVSQRGGSPQGSETPNRRSDSVMSSPGQSVERMYDESYVGSGRLVGNDMYDDDIEGSREADNTDFSRNKSKERANAGYILQNRKGSQGKKVQVGKRESKHIREACSGTEGQNLGTPRRKFDVKVADAKPLRSSSQGSKKRSKEDLFGRDESSAFDALQTLANLSLMILPEANENDSALQVKEENNELVDDSQLLQVMPASRQSENHKFSVLTGKRNQSISRLEVADNKVLKSAKNLVDNTNAATETKESQQSITKVSRKRQKIVAPKILKGEAHINTNPKESQEAEARDAGQMSMPKGKCTSQSSSLQLTKHAEHVSSSIHSIKEASNSALSPVRGSEVTQANIHTKVRSRRKMYKPQILEVAKFSDIDESSVQCPSFNDKAVDLKGRLFNCLSNQLTRRWCAFEWFYSAIDDPWFAKREFVEYLYHVGLGHVPRLTRVEWGVIRSSLGKPRRFSDQFLKEEKDKLNQYQDSVRTHYIELCSGTRDGLPTDLARPLSVGQRVIAIYPRTREIHDGTVLTVDHKRCCIQFDRPELGVEKIMDIDCMPLNPFENMPASLMTRTMSADKFCDSLNELKMNGLGKNQKLEGYTKLSSREKLENMDDVPHLPPSTYPIKDNSKQLVAPFKSDLQSRSGPKDTTSNQHAAYSVPGTLAQIQAKEADVQAIAELTRALDKKEAVVFELRRMNDDVLENQTDGEFALQNSDAFKKQYAAVLVQLNEVNAQVSSALYRLRQRNTYQWNFHLTSPRPVGDSSGDGGISTNSDHPLNHTEESERHVDEIVEISRTKARTMVDIVIQAMPSLKVSHIVEIDKAVDYVKDRIPLDDSCVPPTVASTMSPIQAPDPKSTNLSDIINKAPIPSELITNCVATLFIIQKCTERQFPPAEVARILDAAVSSLQPYCSQNLHLYAEIQKCMGIIKNQILALVPT